MIDFSLGNFHISSTSLIDSDWVENYVDDIEDDGKLMFEPRGIFFSLICFEHAVN